MKSIYLIPLSLLALSLSACKTIDSVEIDKFSETGQCLIKCLEAHGNEVPQDGAEILLVE